jgi:anti-sigma B factor antagonist
MITGSYTAEPDVTVTAIEGRMNLGSNLMFLEGDLKKIVESGARKLILDMNNVNYVDSAGLGVLVGMAGMLRSVEGRMAVFGLQTRVSQIFDVAKVHRVLPVFPDANAAIEFMRAPAPEED